MTTTTVTPPLARRALGLLASLSPLLLLTLLFWPAAPAQADNLIVGDGMHASSCNMFSLGQVMNTHLTGTITFACGGPATIVITQSGGLNALAGQIFTIDGSGIITFTGNDAFSLFWVHSGGTLTLTHMLLTHGASANGSCLFVDGQLGLSAVEVHDCRAGVGDSGGAAFINAGGSATLDHANVHDNSATFGGGVYNLGRLTVTGSTFVSNTVGGPGASYQLSGGGLDNDGSGWAQISDSQFISNSATSDLNSLVERGGGIYNAGVLTLQRVTLTSNQSDYGGGGMSNSGAATVTDSSLVGNVAHYYGGGIHNFSSAGHLVLINDTLSENQAENDGGGLFLDSGSASLTNSTITSNTADVSGGGLYNDGAITLTNVTLYGNSALPNNGGALERAGGSVTLANSIVALSPSGGNCDGTNIVSMGYNLSSDFSCQLAFNQSTDLPPSTDPNLGPLANNGGLTLTHLPLSADSPGIDIIPKFTNGCGTTLVTDQRGGARPINGMCDLGAVEYGALLPRLWLPLTRR